MAWTRKQIAIAFLMVITGSINTLSTKWADRLVSVGSDKGEARPFHHAFLQACSMFLGEILCLVAFKLMYFYKKRRSGELEDVVPLVQGNQHFNPFIFFPPALCDMLATSIMYVGLTLTFASSFQMLRGSVIIFTGLLSVSFLERVLKSSQWIGIGFIITGLAVVGLSDIIFNHDDNFIRNNVITGDLLIIMAQIISATQMVYEEKFVNKHNVPALQAVGWEGIFGFGTLAILLIPMYFIPVTNPFGTGNPQHMVLEDAIDGFVQLSNNPSLVVAFTGTVISIAFFNFAGVSITKELSATTRMVLDSVRTLVIWAVSLALLWQDFNYLQIVGFLTLIFGMCLYNNILIVPTLERWGLVPSRRPRSLDISPPSAVFASPVVVTDNN